MGFGLGVCKGCVYRFEHKIDNHVSECILGRVDPSFTFCKTLVFHCYDL